MLWKAAREEGLSRTHFIYCKMKNQGITLIAAALVALAGQKVLAQTQNFDVTLERIGPFCPIYLIEGDRDFAGIPQISIRSDLRISPDGHKLMLSTRFYAREEGGDYTTVDQTFIPENPTATGTNSPEYDQKGVRQDRLKNKKD